MVTPPGLPSNTYHIGYVIEGRFLGTSEVAADSPPHSVAYACSTCGDIWARIVVQGSHFEFYSRPCRRHTRQGVSDWSAIPGSVLHGNWQWHKSELATMWWAQSLDVLPLPVVQWEFARQLEHFDKDKETI